ncbi:MAG: hypothetical protein ACI8X5_002421 [Planctomycetota bacterium]|jgi:hypothetical protein
MARSPVGALKCRWCGNRLQAKAERAMQSFEVQGSRIGSLLISFTLFPQVARFTPEKIVITTYRFFGLTSNDEEILWEKVAGFAHHNGILWDQISIETRGQTPASIACLDKSDSQRIREVLQGLER